MILIIIQFNYFNIYWQRVVLQPSSVAVIDTWVRHTRNPNSTNRAPLSLNDTDLMGSKKSQQVESQGKKMHIQKNEAT